MTTSEKEEQFRKLIVELRLMQGSAEVLQRRLELMQNAATDLSIAESSLSALKETKEGTSILVPLGGNAYANAQLGDLKMVIVGIGADISVEMELGKAVEEISTRLGDVEKTAQSVQQQLEQVVAQMQVHQDVINRLSSELRGEAPRV